MHDRPRQVLKDIVRTYGRSILRDARRSRALLMDFCGEFKGEINLVEMALREDLPEAWEATPQGVPRGLVTAQLAKRLEDAYYLPSDAARWAVETVVAALEADSSAKVAEVHRNVQVVSSKVAATVHVRPWLADEDGWQVAGRTPGEVALPVDGEVRLSGRLDDLAAAALAKDLAGTPVHQLDLSYSPLTARGLGHLLGQPSLVALDLSRSSIDDGALALLRDRGSLRSLNLWGVETITDGGVSFLGHVPNLEWLELGRCIRVTDAGVAALRDLTELVYLGLAGTKISDGALNDVGRLSSLRSLNLSQTGIDGRGLSYLSGLDWLSQLDLSGCVNLRPDRVAALRELPSLAELRLGRCGLLTDEALLHLRPMIGVRSLHLEGLDITDAGLLYLRKLSSLTSLDLAWTPITDQGVARLTDLRGLQLLNLAGTPITDAATKHLTALPGLATLDLSNTMVSDVGLRHLRYVTTLVTLDLEGTRVRDAGLVHLGSLPSLERLYLGGTAISDVGLELLSRITNLREVDLAFCSGITPDGVELLRDQGVTVSA